MIDLIQKAFDSQIISASRIDPGYPNTNDVWLVQTYEGWHILKVSGHRPHEHRSPFWAGLEELFGCQPHKEFAFQPSISEYLSSKGEIPVPKILKCIDSNQPLGSPYLIAERMPGQPMPYQSSQAAAFAASSEIMRQLGRHVGKLHLHQHSCFGNFPETAKFPASEFPERLAYTMQELASDGWEDDLEVKKTLLDFVRAAQQTQPPKHISLIMPDIGYGQFLTDGHSITALVDFESYIRGPVELELVELEMWIGDGKAFRSGYEEANSAFPAIAEVRTLYRFFLYLLHTWPRGFTRNWLHAPACFE